MERVLAEQLESPVALVAVDGAAVAAHGNYERVRDLGQVRRFATVTALGWKRQNYSIDLKWKSEVAMIEAILQTVLDCKRLFQPVASNQDLFYCSSAVIKSVCYIRAMHRPSLRWRTDKGQPTRPRRMPVVLKDLLGRKIQDEGCRGSKFA